MLVLDVVVGTKDLVLERVSLVTEIIIGRFHVLLGDNVVAKVIGRLVVEVEHSSFVVAAAIPICKTVSAIVRVAWGFVGTGAFVVRVRGRSKGCNKCTGGECFHEGEMKNNLIHSIR